MAFKILQKRMEFIWWVAFLFVFSNRPLFGESILFRMKKLNHLTDFIIVIVSIITWIIPYYLTSAISFNVRIFRLLRIFRAVKAFRSIRVLRAISFLRSLQIIISTVLKSIPAMGNIVLMAGLFLYMFAIIGTVCYRDIDSRRFGGLGPSLFRLFQMMTLDHWSEIYKQNENQSWSMYYFVVIVIIVECFIFLKYVAPEHHYLYIYIYK